MPFDPTVTSQQCAALMAQVASSTRRISPSEIKGGLILVVILAALLVSYETNTRHMPGVRLKTSSKSTCSAGRAFWSEVINASGFGIL